MLTALISRASPSIARSRLANVGARRAFAEDATKPVPATKPKPQGGGLLSRISSFFVGAGLTALVTQFYIFQELREGNKSMIAKQKELDARLAKLEGK